MTIAMVYVTDEGIVLGADSTSSAPCDIGLHYFNFNQKVFEIGENSTLGMVTWGLGSLSPTSYRTLIARLSDQLSEVPPVNVLDVAKRWSSLFWEAYDNHSMIARWRSLNQKHPYVEKALPVLPNSLVSMGAAQTVGCGDQRWSTNMNQLPESPREPSQTVAETSRRLLNQASTTGAYRPADLFFVLGHPRDRVQLPAVDTLSCCSHARNVKLMDALGSTASTARLPGG